MKAIFVGSYLVDMAKPHTTLVRWTLPASVAVHAGLLGALLLVAVPRRLEPPVERVISVDLVRPEPAPAAAVPEPPQNAVVTPTPVAPAAVEAAEDDGMVAATSFYAAGILTDPANAEIRKNFPLLARDEQVVQLCNMEALEQLRAGTAPLEADALVGYAFDSVSLDGGVLDAPGGAVRSGGRWFHLRYHCAVAPDIASVSAFEYALGPLIPGDQWEEHFLNADDEGLD